MKFIARSASLLLLLLTASLVASGQCSSLYTTPEFPVATHPSDMHTQSWGCNLFTPTQFGTAPATLTGIQIYVDNSFGPTTYASQTVWMRHTAVSTYPSAVYPTTAGFTQCFSGTYSFPMSGLYTVNFNVSNFSYDGVQNVEILFENRSGTYRVNEPWFRRTPTYGAGVYRSKWNGNFGFGGFPGTASDGSAVRLTYTLSLTANGGGGCGSILPVQLVRFVGEYRGNEAHLEWESTGEKADGEYLLERSENGRDFVPVTTVAFLTPLDQPHQYEFNDLAPGAEQTFYRIARTDVDGSREFSEAILLRRNPQEERELLIWPNPAGDVAEVALPWRGEPGDQLELVAADGRVVWSAGSLADKEWAQIDLAGLPSGLYLVRLTSQGARWTGKLLH